MTRGDHTSSSLRPEPKVEDAVRESALIARSRAEHSTRRELTTLAVGATAMCSVGLCGWIWYVRLERRRLAAATACSAASVASQIERNEPG